MKSRITLLTAMYWLFKIWFGLQLLITLIIVSLNYVDWLSPILGDQKLSYTIRGNFGLTPANELRPDKNFTLLNSDSSKEVIALRTYGGWARVDYTSFSEFVTFKNCMWVLFDVSVWLCWLLLLYWIMKLLGKAQQHQQVFNYNNIKYLRLIALFVGLSGFFDVAKDYLFTIIISNEISWNGFTIYFKGSVKAQLVEYSLMMFLILVIAEFVKQGVTLKQENDLTI
jgi:hypothetical protein